MQSTSSTLGLGAGILFSALVACSSGSGTGPNGPGSSGTPACACTVTDNGVTETIACGGESCVNRVTYSCSSGAEITKGGACTTPPDAGSGSDGGGNDGPLTCSSYTWCASGSTTQWNGQVLPTGRGGTIPPGLYREAYLLAEKESGTTFGDYGSALLFRGGTVRQLGGPSRVGSFTTAGAKLSFDYTATCDDQSGETLSSSPSKVEYDYFVDAQGQLFLFSTSTGSAGSQTIARVYKRQATLCGGVPESVPASPGDSFVCNVTNCGCTEASNGPSSASTCDFVNGR